MTFISPSTEVKAGRWPEKPTECVVVLSKYGTVTDYALYSMGLRDSAELDKMIQQFAQNQNVDVPSDFRTYSYDELMGLKFKLVNSADTYVYDDTYGIWKSKADDKDYMQQLVENGEDITIVGIVQPDYTASASMLTSGIAYPASLTEKVMDDAADSVIVKQQMADPATNVLTGESFGKAESLRDFDLTSLFSIDTNALKNAFSFDADALDFDLNGAFDLSSGSFDLSSLIDFSDFSLDIDELPDIDLSDAFAELDLSVSPEALQDLVHKVFKDYKKYIIGNGILNFKKWSFSAYLKSEQFQKLMAESMKDLVDPDKLQGQLSSALQTTIQTVMETYSDQITEVLKSQLDAAIQKGIVTFQDQIQSQLKTAIQQNIGKLSSQMESAIKIDASAFQKAIQLNMTTSELTELMRSTLRSSSATYEANLTAFGYADEASPSQIKIYPKDFASKATILEKLDAYNAGMSAKGEDEKMVQYTDLVGTLMTSVTEIVNMISSMMVAFVSISLVSLLHHDRRHHLYQRPRAPEGDRHPARHRRFQAERLRGVQRRDLHHRPLLGRHGHRPQRDTAHPRKHHHPESLRHFDPRCLPARGCSPLPRGTGYPAHHSGRHHPGPRRSQVQPRQSPARRVNPRALIPGILSAPAAGIPGFFRLIFAPARRFSLYPSCMRTHFFALKVTKEYGRPGRF